MAVVAVGVILGLVLFICACWGLFIGMCFSFYCKCLEFRFLPTSPHDVFLPYRKAIWVTQEIEGKGVFCLYY